MRKGCVRSPRFNRYTDVVIEETKIRTQVKEAELILDGKVWEVPTCLFADDSLQCCLQKVSRSYRGW